jgi:PAS domain-containing protein
VETFVHGAAAMLANAEPGRLTAYDAFPAPVYATDARGTLTYYNQACVDFAGRVPAVGEDRYCVSWKLRSDSGEILPHDQCPMAIALHENRPVRGVEAFAERPDGGRRRFRPFATPARDAAGTLVGAVNLLVPTDGEACRELLSKAQKCRRLSNWVADTSTSATLAHMAADCEAHAAVLALD